MVHRTKKHSMATIARKAVNRALAKTAEVKKNYTNGTHSILTSGVLAVPLAGLAVGNLSDERIGNNVSLLSMNMRANFENGDPNNTIRMLCVELYEAQNLVTFIATDLFNGITTPFVGAINSQVDRQIVKRVLYDRTINVNPNWNGASKFRYMKAYCRLSKTGSKIQFADGVSQPSSGHYYWAFVSDSAIAPSPRVQYALETRYTDL